MREFFPLPHVLTCLDIDGEEWESAKIFSPSARSSKKFAYLDSSSTLPHHIKIWRRGEKLTHYEPCPRGQLGHFAIGLLKFTLLMNLYRSLVSVFSKYLILIKECSCASMVCFAVLLHLLLVKMRCFGRVNSLLKSSSLSGFSLFGSFGVWSKAIRVGGKLTVSLSILIYILITFLSSKRISNISNLHTSNGHGFRYRGKCILCLTYPCFHMGGLCSYLNILVF